MFEARMAQGALLKKVIESIKDLVQDANFDCTPEGFQLQAMDISHVSLVSMFLRSEGFQHYRCDRNLSMGMNLNAVSKLLKCADNNDVVTIKADDAGDSATFLFEAPDQTKLSDFQLKLMDIDAEHLGIPETEYSAVVKMPASEFQRVCRDLATLGESVVVSASKDSIKFSTTGDIGSANVVLKQTSNADKPDADVSVEIREPVSLTFALRYLNSFTKATPLSDFVTLSLSRELPVMVEYRIPDAGHIRYYLAPKIDDEGEEADNN